MFFFLRPGAFAIGLGTIHRHAGNQHPGDDNKQRAATETHIPLLWLPVTGWAATFAGTAATTTTALLSATAAAATADGTVGALRFGHEVEAGFAFL